MKLIVPVVRFKYVYGVINSLLVPTFLFLFAVPVIAIEFEHGEIYGSWDTTISLGQSFRTQDIDRDIIGLANGGNAFSVNGDNGNLNYRNGTYSALGKFTTELEANYKNYGTFVRANGFKDIVNSNAGDRTELTKKADRLVTSNLNLLDAFVWGGFNIGSMPTGNKASRSSDPGTRNLLTSTGLITFILF